MDPRGRVCARDARARERVAAQVGTTRLDHALADGAEPESDPVLALRAGRLASAHTRLVYARSVRRILRAADVPGSLIAAHSSAVRLDRVTRAHCELELLVDRLTAPAPVSARGVALVSLILGDGGGPLYCPGSRDDLGAMVMEAVNALDPVSGW